MQGGREGSCFPGSGAPRALCAGKCPKQPANTAAPKAALQPRPAGRRSRLLPQPVAHARLAPGSRHPQPLAPVGNTHPWVLGSSTQPCPQGVREGAAGCRQSSGTHPPGTSSYRDRTQPTLGTHRKCCCAPTATHTSASFSNKHKLYFIQSKAN